MQSEPKASKPTINFFVMLPLLCAVGGGAWAIQESRVSKLKEQLEAYQTSEKWELPSTLKKMNTLSSQLSLDIDERNQLDKYKKSTENFESKNKKLQLQLNDAISRLTSATNALNTLAMKNDNFSIGLSQSFPLVNNTTYLSVTSIYPSWITGTFQEKGINLDIGQAVNYAIGTLNCHVVLTQIDAYERRVIFTRSCSEHTF
ncbi:hypothetical protein KOL70_06260 [Pantoea sp. B270]|uniref:hypothetical protein n=1 Tax=Pantoea sp. B270 TaxID=2836826 RepID=UPI001BFF9570|nr:hypothetical protein [Pantoea sp. B270]MBU6517606.1 hypothetical protein [Pantoea sp. B270]